MAPRPRRTLSPERAASSRLHALARDAARPLHLHPTDRAQAIAEMQEIAAPYPHLLGQEAGLLLGSAKNTTLQYEAAYCLRAAQLLIDAGADLAQVEHWTEIGYQRTRPNPNPSYPRPSQLRE